MKDASQPSLSVITVVFNDVKNIRRTMLSVIGQTWEHIEYIVIDGGSTDGTQHEIELVRTSLSLYLSEPDKGIYDAMNKGLKRATGDYVLFMNSGDEFYAADTVARMFAALPGGDVYYGETEMIDDQLNSLGPRRHRAPAKLSHSSFRFGMSVSHQAIAIRRTLTGPFDTRYALSADIDWILRALRKAGSVVNTGIVVAKYLAGGMSKKRHRESLKERYAIFRNHYGTIPNLFNHATMAFRLALDRLKPAHKRLKT